MRVLLIAGGWSSEREVALSGAKGIREALQTLGHEVDFLDPALEFGQLVSRARAADFAFINLHGSPGEDGLLQAMLERAGCPYQGAGPAGSFLALNKAAAKIIFRDHGITTPAWEFLTADPGPDWLPAFGLPAFVKTNTGGSSLDMGRAETPAELRALVSGLTAKGCEVLVEEALAGVELTCAVLGDEPLPPIMIRPLTKGSVFFDYQSKYAQGGAEELCPAPVDDSVIRALQENALAAHRALGIEGVSRSDFIRHEDTLYLLEVNTLPGMTPTSLLPKAAAAAGMDFPALIARLMELGLKRAEKGS